MNNIKILTRITVYQNGKMVSETSQNNTETNTGDFYTTCNKMYANLVNYYTPLAKNKVTSFACKDSLNYVFEYGVCVCTVCHVIGNVSVVFQMCESLYTTK